jgi:hypothetical protein
LGILARNNLGAKAIHSSNPLDLAKESNSSQAYKTPLQFFASSAQLFTARIV